MWVFRFSLKFWLIYNIAFTYFDQNLPFKKQQLEFFLQAIKKLDINIKSSH